MAELSDLMKLLLAAGLSSTKKKKSDKKEGTIGSHSGSFIYVCLGKAEGASFSFVLAGGGSDSDSDDESETKGTVPTTHAESNGSNQAPSQDAKAEDPSKAALDKLRLSIEQGNLVEIAAAIDCIRNTINGQVLNQFYRNKGRWHVTPLIHAVRKENQAAVDLLLQCQEVDVNVQPTEKPGPLFTALGEAYRARSFVLMLKLLRKGADASVCNDKKQTLAHYCAHSGFPGLLSLLATDGKCDLNAADEDGDTPLIVAAQSGELGVVGFCCGRGVNVNAVNKFGFTALHYAAAKGFGQQIHLLLAAGADASIKDHQGLTPLQLATKKGKMEGITLLSEWSEFKRSPEAEAKKQG